VSKVGKTAAAGATLRHRRSAMRRALAFVICLATLMCQPPLVAQAQPAAAPLEPEPGIRLTRLIDRDEIRVSRLELQPGAARRAHAHDDVEYHVWVPVSGSLEITVGTAAPVAASAGQAVFMKRGTSHGFRNTGTAPATVFEIFVKKSTTVADEGTVGEGVVARAIVEALAPVSQGSAMPLAPALPSAGAEPRAH
jgi:quercetin dioxygenase-like cupin family protein